VNFAAQGYAHGKLNVNGLHTHYNADRYGDDQLICYAIFNFWDSAPGSTLPLSAAAAAAAAAMLLHDTRGVVCSEQGRGRDRHRAGIAQAREGAGHQRDARRKLRG
jgi:hypothetical protein